MKKAIASAIVLSIAVFSIAGLAIFLFFESPLSLLENNWKIAPIAIVAAAFANATAVGGGFLFVPLFIFGYGLTATAALKLSLATQAFGMSSGALGWSRHYILKHKFISACAASFVGMYLGTYWWNIDNVHIKLIFGWVNIAIGIAILLEMKLGAKTHRAHINDDTLLKKFFYLLVCVAGGLINSWASIGIGEVVALYLMFVYRMRIDYAIATGVAVLAFDSIVGLAFHSYSGGIRWDYLVFTAPGVIIGGRYGAKLGRWAEAKVIHSERAARISPLKWIFTGIVVIDGIIMLFQVYTS